MIPEVERHILLNPGPATTTDSVKRSLVVADICPREKEFADLVTSIRKDLPKVVSADSKHTAVLFSGSGTAATEACLSSVISPQQSVLIINNGSYCERMSKICDVHKIKHIDFKIEWGCPINLEALEKFIIEHRSAISHMACVHHETSTGILNPLDKLAQLASKYNLQLIVDAMSSYAGLPIDYNQEKIDYLISSANKCLQGMAGISFVICRYDSLKQIKDLPPKSFYLGLWNNFLFQENTKQFQFTPPVQVMYSLRKALDEFFAETQEIRTERYFSCYNTLVEGIQSLGLKFFVEKQFHSKILTTFVAPEHPNFNFEKLHDFLLESNITIYPGKLLDKKTFRIANIGDITPKDIEFFLSRMKIFFKREQLLPNS